MRIQQQKMKRTTDTYTLYTRVACSKHSNHHDEFFVQDSLLAVP